MVRMNGRQKNFETMTGRLKKELLASINHGADPYMMYALSIFNYMGLAQNVAGNRDLNRFMTAYRYSPYDDLAAPDDEDLQEARTQFAGTLFAYYLWCLPEGAGIWQNLLKWLPMDLRERQQVDQWGQKAVFSYFEGHWEKNALVFTDLYTKERYPLAEAQLELIEPLEDGECGLAWLLPVDGTWLVISLLPLVLTEKQLARRKELNPQDWAYFLIEAGADHIQTITLTLEFSNETAEEEEARINQVTKEFMEEIDEIFERLDTFDPSDLQKQLNLKKAIPHPLIYKEEETPQEWASRLLDESVEFRNFPHREQVEAFMVTVLTRYPHLFIPHYDATFFLEALGLVITTREPLLEEGIIDTGEMRFFWYLLFRDTLPDAVAALEPYKVTSQYWQELRKK